MKWFSHAAVGMDIDNKYLNPRDRVPDACTYQNGIELPILKKNNSKYILKICQRTVEAEKLLYLCKKETANVVGKYGARLILIGIHMYRTI